MIYRIAMLTQKDIDEFKEYLVSGRWEEDFGYRTPDGQAEMLDFLESIFELCDIADDILTKKFYKNMNLFAQEETVTKE